MKQLYSLITFLLLAILNMAQTPETISYQAIVRNTNNQLVVNKDVKITVTILQGESIENSSSVYAEIHNTYTNSNGLVTLEIGSDTVEIISGIYNTINWSNKSFVKIEVDIDIDGINDILTYNQLLSVPYAIHSKTAENISKTTYFPRSLDKNYWEQDNIVSFSGGAGINFSEASPIALQFEGATPIFPHQIRYIDSKHVDVKFDIPWSAATGLYDIIINPNDKSQPTIIERAILIGNF